MVVGANMPTLCELCRRWRRWIRPLVIAFYVAAVVVAIPLVLWAFHSFDLMYNKQAWFIGGWFVILTLPIAIWGIVQHLVHYTRPDLQIRIIRILWMVPIYSCDAWFGMRFPHYAIYFDTLRECYEAYVIYNFMSYLLTFLYSEYDNLEDDYSRRSEVQLMFPLCCMHWNHGKSLVLRCKHGVLQYTVIRPILTILALITNIADVYKEGDFSARGAWTYIVMINNFSQMWALYCLVIFYVATKEELQPIRPVGKFMCIKAVVFFSFWQSVFIALLVELGVIKDDKRLDFSSQDLALGLQDFIICIEMFIAAIVHLYVFSHRPYVDTTLDYQDCIASFRAMWDVSDVRADVVDHVRHIGSTVSSVSNVTRAKSRAASSQDDSENSETAPLLRGDSNTSVNYTAVIDRPLTSPGGIYVDETQQQVPARGHRQSEPKQNQADRRSSSGHLVEITDSTSIGRSSDVGMTDDNVSTNTLDSSTGLNRSITASLNNFARFSDTDASTYDTVSQTSQHSIASKQT